MNIKSLLTAALFAVSASVASAATVSVACGGAVADGEARVCPGSINLATYETTFAVDLFVANDPADGSADGSVTLSTFVDPFWSTGDAAANVLLELSILGNDPYVAAGLSPAATLTFGSNSVDLVPAGNSLVSPNLHTLLVSLPGTTDLTLSFSELLGGEQLSIRVAAVPLPAGILLLGTALGGLAVARRRKKA